MSGENAEQNPPSQPAQCKQLMASADQFPGKCTAQQCRCARFDAQFYRPALCTQCFHDVEHHFPQQYSRIIEDDKLYFVHTSSGSKLYAQPAFASASILNRAMPTATPPQSAPLARELPAAGMVAVTKTVYDAKFMEAPKPIEHVGTSAAVVTQSSSAPPVSSAKAQPTKTSSSVITVRHQDTLHTAVIESMLDGASAAPVDAMKAMGLDIASLAAQIATTFHGQDAIADAASTADMVDTSKSEAPDPAVVAVAFHQSNTAPQDGPSPAVQAVTHALDTGRATAIVGPWPSDIAPQSTPVIASQPIRLAADLGLFLDPVVGDPLLVDVNAMLSLHAQQSGVAVFSITQPFEETYHVPRYLLLTPFTIISVAAHPTRLGIGILKWERSLLSLQRLTLARAVSTAALSPTPAKPRASLLRMLTKRPSLREEPILSQSVGVLANFAPETAESITLLRLNRGGCKPVRLEGVLLKRKKSNWRQTAPLGPLAWKKRYFVLQASKLSYYTASPTLGGVLKGEVPLTGWVEVARIGAGSALESDLTTRQYCFMLRTRTTFHVFQASSQEECESWVSSLTINAQHMGAFSDNPQMLLCRDTQESHSLIAALQQRRNYLVSSMPPKSGISPVVVDDAGAEISANGNTFLSFEDANAIAEAGGVLTPELLSSVSPEDARLLELRFAASPLSDWPSDSANPFARSDANLELNVPHDAQLGVVDPAGNLILVGDAANSVGYESTWVYLDDENVKQGPFTDQVMQSWLVGGYLHPDMLIRNNDFQPLLDPTCGVDEAGVPTLFVPLRELFANIGDAFQTGCTNWIDSYRSAWTYQSLIRSAASFGITVRDAAAQVSHMKQLEVPPDLGILLDMLGCTQLSSLTATSTPLPAQGATTGAVES